MGSRFESGAEPTMSLTEGEIQEVLADRLIDKGHSMVIPNTRSVVPSEADLISITDSGYLHEYEIKVSRSDFRAELRAYNREGNHSMRKRRKHAKIDTARAGGNPGGYRTVPNRFWLVTPAGLIDPDEVPTFWGRYEIDPDQDKHYRVRVNKERRPGTIHDDKPGADLMRKLGKNLTKRYWDSGDLVV